jgi:hypothetical protein
MSQKRFVEVRWGSRYKFGATAELSAHGMPCSAATIRDASLSGAFVETSSSFPLFTRIAVRAVSQPCEWLEACVVRSESDGVAVRWMEPGLRPISNLLPPRTKAVARSPLDSRWCQAT